MTAATTTPVPTVQHRSGLALAVGATGTALACNGLVLGTQLFLDSRDYSAVAGEATHLAHYLVWTLCLVALSQIYPRLGSLRGETGRRLPPIVLVLAGAGAALDACARFVAAFVTPYLADNEPALVDTTPDAILLVPLLATGVVAMAGTAALGISALRRRVFPKGAAVLLVVGGIAIPVLGPVSNVLLGGALIWIGLTLRAASRP